MLDILIQNGTIIDGTGAPARKGAIGIEKGKLVAVTGAEPAARVIDARGRIVCPGFIDAHSHSDYIMGLPDAPMFKSPQGITTELCGQCGGSRAPVTEEHVEQMRDFFRFLQPAEEVRRWTTYERYLEYAEAQKSVANARFYVGHRIIRAAVMGWENRPATAKELDHMRSLIREAMEAGAAGFSTGLIYVPGCYAGTEEILALTKVIAPFDGIYASHMRNESCGVVDCVKETIDVGRKAGVRVDISHHKIAGKDNWGKQRETLELIHQANEEGIPVTIDQYPYTRSMTTLRACIPPRHWAQGLEAMNQKLRDPAFRAQLRTEIEDKNTPFENQYLSTGGWEGIYCAASEKTPDVVGKSIAQYAAELGKDPWDTYFDIMVENGCKIEGTYATMCDEDVCEIIQSPYCVVGTDGGVPSWQHKGHPRVSSSFTHAINYFVKEKKVLPLEQMIHKMTGLTAERLLVSNKGLLKPGYDADVLIIDFENLKDLATYADPNRFTEGMDYVIVGGQIVYSHMQFTGAYSGRVIRRGR